MNWYKKSQSVSFTTDYDRDSRSIYTRNQKEHHRTMIMFYKRKIRRDRRNLRSYQRKDDDRKVNYYEKAIDKYERKITYHMNRVLYYQRKEDQSHLKEKQRMRRLLGI